MAVVVIVVLEAEDLVIARPVEAHKGIEGGRLQTGDLFYQGLVEPVIYIFVLFLLYQPSLEGQHPAVLPTIEQLVEVDAHTYSPIAGRTGALQVVRSAVTKDL